LSLLAGVAGRPQANNINGCDGASSNRDPDKTRRNLNRLSHFLVPLLAGLIVTVLFAVVIMVISAVTPQCKTGIDSGPTIGGVIRIGGCP
jgi:hypothetical protein